MTEDENPDRLCKPQYHRDVTVMRYMSARMAVASTESTIAKLEKQLEREKDEKYLRETEIREWMRRDKLVQVVYPLKNLIPQTDHVLYVDTDVSHDFAVFRVLPVQKI